MQAISFRFGLPRTIRSIALLAILLSSLAARVRTEKFQYERLRVETVLDNGKPRKLVDLVIIGDAYLKEDLEDGGTFERDVARITHEFFKLEPFRTYKYLFNVHAVYAESFDRGAEDSLGEEQHRTILNTSFDQPGGRLLTFQRPENVVRLAKNAPAADIVLVVVNDPRYGGAGAVVWDRVPAPVCSNSVESIQIAIHELGHSFANLGDEYADESSAGTYPLPHGTADFSYPNLTLARHIDTKDSRSIQKSAKWKHFFELPGADGFIGAFEGGHYRSTGVFRPQANCKMRADGFPFCYVCQEALARSIHEVAGIKFKHKKYHQNTPIRRDD